ncbi:hypothetical protein Tco_1031570 [Tanacetum coccineum]|uniref:Uncharacterized protein n=1 Tax=Tanacetum coccineum TaxID=301880 RepID=A0ABQ5GA75_9ASTR
MWWEPLPKDVVGASTQRCGGSLYLKMLWEPLPKDVVDASWQMELLLSFSFLSSLLWLGVVAKFTWSRDQVYLEWWPRVLLGVQGGDGGGRVLARW